MKFQNVAEAFNYYRTQSIEDIQKRAAAISAEIDNNAEADIEALNIELKGLKEAKDDAESRSAVKKTLSLFDSTSMKPQKNFDPETVAGSEEYRSAFYKTLLGQKLSEIETRAFDAAQKLAETRAIGFNASGDTAAVLPTSTLDEIVKKARTQGGLIGEARAFALPTKLSVPIGTPATKAAWHTEGLPVESEKLTIDMVSFDGYEILKVFSISAKVRQMSISSFESYLVDELTACVMDTIGDALVNGSGTSQGTGLEKGITWDNHKVEYSETASYADVVKTAGMLKRGYSQGAKWAMNNNTLFTVFYGMIDTTGRPVFISDPKSESIGKILGYDVVIDDNIADGVAYLGNFSKYLGYNMPQGILVEASRESSFKSGLIDYRALAIADCKPLVDEAFVKLCKAAGD